MRLLILALISFVSSQSIQFSSLPQDFQLYCRGENDSASVAVRGTVTVTEYDSVVLQVLKEGAPYFRTVQSEPALNVSFSIHAEKADHTINVYLDDSLIVTRSRVVCGDAILLEGQSNMAAGGGYPVNDSTHVKWVRSFGQRYYFANDTADLRVDTAWGLARSQYHNYHCDLGMHGYRIGEKLVEAGGIPVALINGAEGGTKIDQHQRNDSDPQNIATIYGRHLYRSVKAGIASRYRAIVWHQGESDANGSSKVDRWAALFDAMYRDWKEDYPSVEKIYVYQINTGCFAEGAQSRLREIQRTLPEQYDDIRTMSTAWVPGFGGCHYSRDGYKAMADAMVPLVAADLYGKDLNKTQKAPNVQEVYFTSGTRDEIMAVFDMPVVWPGDTLGAAMKDYFFLDSAWGEVLSGEPVPGTNALKLVLSGPATAATLTYLPNRYYHDTEDTYMGPFIKNENGVGAFSFYRFPIAEQGSVAITGHASRPNRQLIISVNPNPFNPVTEIRIAGLMNSELSAGQMLASLFSPDGKRIEQLKGFSASGVLRWNGAGHASGVYLLRVRAGARQAEKLLILSK